jgi:hypothetical protein
MKFETESEWLRADPGPVPTRDRCAQCAKMTFGACVAHQIEWSERYSDPWWEARPEAKTHA